MTNLEPKPLKRPGPGLCLLCGMPLPPSSWWARVTGTVPRTHSHKGVTGELCWADMNKRLGIENPGPKPR